MVCGRCTSKALVVCRRTWKSDLNGAPRTVSAILRSCGGTTRRKLQRVRLESLYGSADLRVAAPRKGWGVCKTSRQRGSICKETVKILVLLVFSLDRPTPKHMTRLIAVIPTSPTTIYGTRIRIAQTAQNAPHA